MSSLWPNLEICIRFVYSFTISYVSAFYFIEIIVLISWIGTQTQIRMEIGSIMFHARGTMRGQICIPYAEIQKFYLSTSFSDYLQRLSLLFP